MPEALRSGPGDRDPVGVAAGVLLGERGGIDHDALPGTGGPDQDGGALGPRERRDAAACSADEGMP